MQNIEHYIALTNHIGKVILRALKLHNIPLQLRAQLASNTTPHLSGSGPVAV